MLDIGTLRLKTVVDEKGVQDWNKSITNVAKNITKTLAGVGVAGAAATTAFVKSTLQSYKQYEQLAGGVEKLYGDAADKMKKYAEEAYKTTQMSANEYMETATQFSASLIDSLGGDTEKAVEYTDKAMRQMADNASVFGTDMEMIQTAYKGFARESYLALDNLKLGYAGTKEGMQELLKDAEAISGIKYDISSYSDIIDAIDVIQEKMGVAGNAAEEASNTIEGSINSAKAAWENFKVALVTGEDLPGKTRELMESVSNAARVIIPKVGVILTDIKKVFQDTIGPMADNPNMLCFNLTGHNINYWQAKFTVLFRNIEKSLTDWWDSTGKKKVEELGKDIGEWLSKSIEDHFDLGFITKALNIGSLGILPHIDNSAANEAIMELDEKRKKHSAIGTSYIPYDGYQAVLHKGERILTASEVDQLESSDITPASNTFYITVPNNPNALETALTLRDMVTDAHYGLA